MLVSSELSSTDWRNKQRLKARSGMVVSWSGRSIWDRFKQLAKAEVPRLVMVSGRLMDVRLVQLAKASAPIVVRAGERVIFCSSEHW